MSLSNMPKSKSLIQSYFIYFYHWSSCIQKAVKIKNKISDYVGYLLKL